MISWQLWLPPAAGGAGHQQQSMTQEVMKRNTWTSPSYQRIDSKRSILHKEFFKAK
jgi:hypothetical protein